MRRENNEIDTRKEFLIKRYSKGYILNVGSGNLHLKNAVNLDMNIIVKPDVIGDFHHLPFKNGQFDTVFAFDIIEHTENLLNELERCGKNIIVECLNFDLCLDNWRNDETHKTYFNKQIFEKFLLNRGYKCSDFGKVMLIALKRPSLLDKQLCFVYRNYKKILKF